MNQLISLRCLILIPLVISCFRLFPATAARQQKQIEVLTAGLQKVTAQLEVRRPAPRNVDDIMAASFGVRQSERILVRSCEAGRDLSATTVAVNLRSK